MTRKFKIKDRVILNKNNPDPTYKGTIVKLQYKHSTVKSCCVLWDKDWPRNGSDYTPRTYYYKPADLKIVDTWVV